jgi:hypothetical protein
MYLVASSGRHVSSFPAAKRSIESGAGAARGIRQKGVALPAQIPYLRAMVRDEIVVGHRLSYVKV